MPMGISQEFISNTVTCLNPVHKSLHATSQGPTSPSLVGRNYTRRMNKRILKFLISSNAKTSVLWVISLTRDMGELPYHSLLIVPLLTPRVRIRGSCLHPYRTRSTRNFMVGHFHRDATIRLKQWHLVSNLRHKLTSANFIRLCDFTSVFLQERKMFHTHTKPANTPQSLLPGTKKFAHSAFITI